MTAGTKRRGPLDQTNWFGYLCRNNYEDVAERMRRMLDGKRYTFVSVHDGHPGLTDVRTGQTLQAPIRTWVGESGNTVGINCLDEHYSWGIATSAATEQDARDACADKGFNYVALVFNDDYRGTRLTIEQFNGFNELLQWIVAVEADR